VEQEPRFQVPALEEPREEATEELADHWRTDFPPAASELPTEVEPDPWLEPRPEFEIMPAPEAESTAEAEAGPDAEVEAPWGAEETPFEVPEAPTEPPPEPSVETTDDWVVEREPDIDTSGLDVAPLETVETSTDREREEVILSEKPFDFEPTSTTFGVAEPTTEAPSEAAAEEPPVEATPEHTAEVRAEPEPKPASEAPGVGAFTLGKRDPKDKARRLARVLVSDMIMYNPERHERALANGTLKEDFEDEIRKSWKEYVEQVGEEMARGNDYWTDALNDVLAKGQRVF